MGLSETDRGTVQRILDGDTEAFRGIITEYKGLVFHVVRSMIADVTDHEDVAQNIFIKVYEHLPQFEFRCGLPTWISRIAYNTCLNYLRRARSHPQDSHVHRVEEDWTDEIDCSHGTHDVQAECQAPLAVICRKEIEATVRESVSQLPLPYRVIVTLHYLDGFSIPELAETLGMPRGTIKSYLFRARALLRSDLLRRYSVEDLFG
ncbi:MAG: sigma-70 family RNA polymerase sigma factor [Planctomycetota bacterium]|nr:MAG: sigma-70 family RNA polymerase sigma factor [Planctomycetota bacterium]